MRLFSQNAKIEALKRAPLFEGLSRKELVEVAKVTEDLQADPGKVLCREGRPGSEFFVIVEGEVEITRGGRRLGRGGAGDFFGEIAVLENVPRTATVTAKTPLRFFVLTRQALRGLMIRHRSVESKVVRALARRVASLSSDPSL